MTVGTTNSVDGPFVGNGIQVVFPISFLFFENSSVVVNLIDANGAPTLQVETTNYTITGAGAPAGGNVTMLVAPPSGTTLQINRFEPFLQNTDLVENDPLSAETLEQTYDRIVMMVQQLAERTGGPTFSLSNDFLGRNVLDVDNWDAKSDIINNLATPLADTDAANKSYVDGAITGAGDLPPSTAVNDFLLGDAASFIIKTLVQTLDILKVNPGTGLINGATDLQVDVGTVLNKIVQVGAGNKIAESLLPDLVTQVEAEVGTVTAQRMWSPLRVAQAIAALADAQSGWVLLETQSISSGVASIDFVNFIDATFDKYIITIAGLEQVNDLVSAFFRVSNDGGATFEAGAAAYEFITETATTGTGFFHQGSSGAAQITMNRTDAWQLGNAAEEHWNAIIEIFNPAAAGLTTMIRGRSAYVSGQVGLRIMAEFAGEYSTEEVVDAFQILVSAGNIDLAEVSLFGVR